MYHFYTYKKGGWENLDVYVQSEEEGGKAVCSISPSAYPILATNQKDSRTFIPDYLLIRNTVP
jgi:hypothetical protein